MMNGIYINAEWYLCLVKQEQKPVYDKDNTIIWFNWWLIERKYKVNKDWLFEEVI